MRLQLSLKEAPKALHQRPLGRGLKIAALALIAGSSAHADDAFTAKTQIYVDSDHTTVVAWDFDRLAGRSCG